MTLGDLCQEAADERRISGDPCHVEYGPALIPAAALIGGIQREGVRDEIHQLSADAGGEKLELEYGIACDEQEGDKQDVDVGVQTGDNRHTCLQTTSGGSGEGNGNCSQGNDVDEVGGRNTKHIV